MVLHDVADRADLVVERAPPLHAEVLGKGDLDRVDVLATPDGLEERVGEAEVEDVLHRLLPEEVIDPIQPVLREDRGQALVQLTGRGEVGAERLLDDQPRVVGEPGARELFCDLEEHRRRRGEVEDGCGRVAERLPAAARRAVPPRRRRPRTRAARGDRRAPSRRRRPRASVTAARACSLSSSSRERAAPDADDRAREETLLGQPVERRHRHPAREIARDPEDDERVGRLAHRSPRRVTSGRNTRVPRRTDRMLAERSGSGNSDTAAARDRRPRPHGLQHRTTPPARRSPDRGAQPSARAGRDARGGRRNRRRLARRARLAARTAARRLAHAPGRRDHRGRPPGARGAARSRRHDRRRRKHALPRRHPPRGRSSQRAESPTSTAGRAAASSASSAGTA